MTLDRMSRFILFAVLAISLVTSAQAKPEFAGQDDGTRAYARGDYAAAANAFSRLAGNGDPRARFFLGIMYSEGTGVPRDDRRAAHWLGLAAAQGDAAAAHLLANTFVETCLSE